MKHAISIRNFSQRSYLIVAALAFGAVGVGLLAASGASGSGTLSLNPASGNVSLGATVKVTITENSGSVPANAVEADLTYDQTKLQYVSIDSTTGPFNLAASSAGGNGTVSLGIASSTAVTGSQTVAVVSFTAIGTGTTAVNFAASSGLAQASDNTDILGTKTGASYTISDTTAPSVPTAVSSSTQTATSISLGWTASTDNVGVSGYKIYRNGTQVGTSATTSYTDSGLTPSNSYAYTVAATDAGGNTSAQSTSASFSTTADTAAPSVPASLTMSAHTLNSISLSWTASTDNVGVSGYKIFRNGTQIGTSAAANYVNTGLVAGTSYSYTIAAYDAAGNTSAQTSASSFATVADTAAPTVPASISSSAQTTSTISLSWTASTDNVAVTTYKVYRNGTQVGTTASNSYVDSGLAVGTSYSYTVAAADAAGNVSAQSTAASFKTVAVPGDANGDGHVDYLDLSIMAASWQKSTDLRADYNHDGIVNFLDLSLLASNWGK